MTAGKPAAAVRVPLDALEGWVCAVLCDAGMGAQDAALAARVLVRTDARGFLTHGVARLAAYLAKLRSGEIATHAEPVHERAGSLLRIDAGGMLGQVAGPRAVEAAVEMAREVPVVTCQLNDSAHLGALGVNLLDAPQAGMVAVMFQAAPPIMAIPGASASLIGNNPFAMAAPRPNGPPVVVDMACCVAARGNVLLAARTGAPIPEGWALDADGEPTTDPQKAMIGSLLPFGGHKGLGLAMIVEVLAGSLLGATFQTSLNGDRAVRSGTGHLNALILVCNPALMGGARAYDEHITAWTEHFVSHGGPDARIPGQRAHDCEREASRLGVALPASLLPELVAIGEAAGLPLPAPTGAPHLPN